MDLKIKILYYQNRQDIDNQFSTGKILADVFYLYFKMNLICYLYFRILQRIGYAQNVYYIKDIYPDYRDKKSLTEYYEDSWHVTQVLQTITERRHLEFYHQKFFNNNNYYGHYFVRKFYKTFL